MQKQIKTMALFAGVLSMAAFCWAADKGAPAVKMAATNSSAKSAANMQAYLGIGVASLPPALVSHLPNVLADGTGVVVAEVAADSPAQKAGLKANDILTSYDDQRLYAPEQFVKLVRHDKPDRQVKLGVVHDGKTEEIKVALGEHSAVAGEQEHPLGMRGPMPMHTERPMTAAEEEAQWSSFDSLTLSRTDKDHFKAEIKYRDEKGRVETRDFQGTREQIRKDIEAQKDLPSNERQQLLRAVSMSRYPLETEFPYVEFIPNHGILWDFIGSESPARTY